MKILLINLAKDVDRLQSSHRKFSDLGLSFERLDAVNGRAMSEKDYQDFVAARPRDSKFGWARGAVGCFLSHMNAWKICAEGDGNCVAIFEDDLHISTDMPYFLNDESWMPEGFDIIRMESPTNRVKLSKSPLHSVRGRGVFRVGSTSWCAGSYILSKQGAQKLLSLPEKFHHTTDLLMFSYEDSVIAEKLNTYQISPSLTIQDKYFNAGAASQAFQSNIETPDAGSTDRVTAADKLKHLNFMELALMAKKTFLGYKRIPFRP